MNPWFVLPALLVLAVLYVMLPVGLAVWSRYRAWQSVRCPVGGRAAMIAVDAGRAGAAAAVGARSLRLVGCSLVPERLTCGRLCLRALP